MFARLVEVEGHSDWMADRGSMLEHTRQTSPGEPAVGTTSPTRRAQAPMPGEIPEMEAPHAIVYRWWEMSKSGNLKSEGWPSYHRRTPHNRDERRTRSTMSADERAVAWDPRSVDPAGILLQTPIFRDLSVPDVEQLLPDVHERSYTRGQIIWLEGDPADVLVIVAEGQLKAHRTSPDGREVILGVYPAVGVTGEVGMFHPAGVRWLSLSAMTRARCLSIRRAPLLSFLARHPAAMQRMLEQLSIAAVRAAYSFSGVAFDDIGHRVASLLLYFADEHGEPTAKGLRLTPRLSQRELAALVAASRENVNRALAALVVRGVVSQRDGHFYVHDRAALEAAARPHDSPDLRRL